MKNTYHIFKSGVLRRKSNTLFLQSKKSDYIPVEMAESLFIHSNLRLNTSTLEFAAQKGVILHFFNRYGQYYGRFLPASSSEAGDIILLQAQHYFDPTKRLQIAKAIILAAMENMLHNIQYYNQRGADLSPHLQSLQEFKTKASQTSSVSELMAYEANFREVYFRAFSHILRNPDFRFTKRSTRPPLDPINSLISYTYSLLYSEVENQGHQTKLTLAISYLHSTNQRHNSLVFDIAEVFKPVIADRLIFTAINHGEIKASDFFLAQGGVYIKKEAMLKIAEKFEKYLRRTYKGKNGATWSYRSWIREEFYKLIRHLKGQSVYEPFTLR